MEISFTDQTRQGTEKSKAETSGSGERSTRQKKALAKVMDESKSFLSAQEIFTILRINGEHVGLTTIYNQLRSLSDQGKLDSIKSESGEVLYRRCNSNHHHHHLICRICGTSIEIEPPGFEQWAEKVSLENSFSDITHVIEITGICKKCSSSGTI